MNKVTLAHDPVTGELKDANNLIVGSWVGDIPSVEPDTKTITPSDLVELARAGYSTDDIIDLRKRDLI